MQSHFLFLVLFAAFVSIVFALLLKNELAEQIQFGGLLFGGFIAAAVVFGWLMYPFPL